MSYEVKMPQLGMNQDTAVVVAWFKKEGEKVEKGDPLFCLLYTSDAADE